MSLLKIQDKWVTFNVREQLLGKLTMGTEIELEIPSLEKKVKGTVYYVRDMGDYAAWRATKATGEWDSRMLTGIINHFASNQSPTNKQ